MKWGLIVCVFLLFPQPVLASIEIYQFLPNPTNESEEWIEIVNTGSEKVELAGYVLDDERDGGSKPYTLPENTPLDPGSILKISKAQSGIALNNSKQKDQSYADMVRLIDKNGQEIDSVTYISTKTDEIISQQPPSPKPTLSPAPSLTNSPVPTATPTPELPKPTAVKSTPTASPTPTVLGNSIETSPTRKVKSTPNPPETNLHKQSIQSPTILLICIGIGLIIVAILRISRKIRSHE